jgi:uncharacterized LabA/DUF88 family protein
MRARVFVDFWNFQLGWNEAVGRDSGGRVVQCDWSKLPSVLVEAADTLLTAAGNPPGLTLEETIVHASVNDSNQANPQEARLRAWLTSWLDRQPSFDVKIRARKPRRRTIRCRSCNTDIGTCPHCSAPLTTAAEKGVDAALVTDLLSLAWQHAYDVAVLVSGDADYIPAVEYVQSQGLKVINAAWPHKGYELQGACWATFSLNDLIPKLTRAV